MNKVYDKSSEGKKKNFQEEIDAILKERDVFEQAVKNGIRTQKEFDDYSQKSAVAIRKLREDQQKIDKAGSKSAEATANRAAKAHCLLTTKRSPSSRSRAANLSRSRLRKS